MKQNEASSFCFKMSGGGIDSLQFQPIRRQILTEPIKRLNFKSNRNKEMTDFLSEAKKIIHTDKFIGFSRYHKILLKMLNLWLGLPPRIFFYISSFYPNHDHEMICHVGIIGI